jgi:hypothetical protein
MSAQVPNSTPPKDPTADWRKYPKGPNFFGIVIGACIVLVVLLAAAYVLLRTDARHLLPHHPSPTPNSLVQPLIPSASASGTWA